MLDDVLKRTPSRADAACRARERLLLAGENGQGGVARRGGDRDARTCRRACATSSGAGCWPRARRTHGLAAMKRYLEDDPSDPRAKSLVATGGQEPALAPPPKRRPPAAALLRDAERGGCRACRSASASTGR